MAAAGMSRPAGTGPLETRADSSLSPGPVNKGEKVSRPGPGSEPQPGAARRAAASPAPAVRLPTGPSSSCSGDFGTRSSPGWGSG